MGFVKDIAKVTTLGLASQVFGKKKKKPETPPKIPTMISTMSPSRPTNSMIGAPRMDSY